MAKKGVEATNPESCFNKAADDEPVFVLRAKDERAPETVRTWAHNSKTFGTHEPEKIEDAFRLADEMEAWRAANVPAGKVEKPADEG